MVAIVNRAETQSAIGGLKRKKRSVTAALPIDLLTPILWGLMLDNPSLPHPVRLAEPLS